MTDDKKTKRIAIEIMEWEDAGGGIFWAPTDSYHISGAIETVDHFGFREEASTVVKTKCSNCWDPRTRWDHAGMVLEKLKECGYDVEQGYTHESPPHTSLWYCYFTKGDDEWHRGYDIESAKIAIFEAAFATLETP